MTPEVRTARLLLTPYTPGDEESFVALFQDVRVSRWMGDGPSPEAEDRALFGRVFTKVYARGLFDVWAVREGGRTVGHAEIKPTPESGGHEIVYALAPDVWGRGLGTELAGALVAEGFGQARTARGVRHGRGGERRVPGSAGEDRFPACPGRRGGGRQHDPAAGPCPRGDRNRHAVRAVRPAPQQR